MPLLVRTPLPFSDESLLGFVLRVSEQNGYDTPWHILRLAGLYQGQMQSAGFPVENLAKILGQNADNLFRLAYQTQDGHGHHFKILDKNLGQSVKDAPLRLRLPAFCPRCVEELSYIEAFWDLNAVIACPKHHCQVLRRCPGCCKAIHWFRPGLLQCNCGHCFSGVNTPAVDTAMAELMGIVQAKLHGRTLMSLPNTSGFPMKALEPLPLCSLLQILCFLGNQNRQAGGARLSEDESATVSAIELLEQWPLGYHRFLEKVGSRFLAKSASAIGLRKQFRPFYEGMFKNRASAGDAAFLREEFVNFGLLHWGHAVVDRKLLRIPESEVEKRFISKTEFARRYGISMPTMDRLVANGTIATKTIIIGNATRVVVDLTHSQVPVESGGTMTTREAAAYLRLPVTVLNHLRKLGIYSTEPRRGRTSLWHTDDLDRFLAKGLALATPLPTPPEHSVTLEEVMRLKLRNATAKADIVAALFDGRLAAVGHKGETLSGLILNKNEIDAFVLQKRIAVEENSYSAAEAAKRTGLDIMAIANAIDLGLLTGDTQNCRLRVTVESVERFNSEYVPLSRLAPTLNTLAQHLLKKCHHHGIAVIQVPRSNVESNQPILPRASEAQLLNIWRTESPAHKNPPRDRQSTYADALKTYLKSLQLAGKPLPRRAGFPNKAAIAKACKFGRDVLYDYPVAIQLLDEFGKVEGVPTDDSGAVLSGENLRLSGQGQGLPSTEYNERDKFGMARNAEGLSTQA